MKQGVCSGCDSSDSKSRPSKFKTVCTFLTNGTCSKTLMNVLNREFDSPMLPEERATDPLAGGMMVGYQCGMLWGATLAAGAAAHRAYGSGPRAEAAAMDAARRLVQAFRARHQHVECIEITETDPRDTWRLFVHFFLKGGTIRCASRMAGFAPDAYKVINAAMGDGDHEAACNPASCAAVLARKMGASDKHAVMAAGFAGGIGLSGSGCGALGAAIWLLGMNLRRQGLSTRDIDARVNELKERFLLSSGHVYACSEIVGRKFMDTDDHARFLRRGGCAELLEAIAAATREIRWPSEAPAEEALMPAA